MGSRIVVGDTPCVITGFTYPEMEYRIVHWVGGERKVDWIKESEISDSEELKKIGFTIE